MDPDQMMAAGRALLEPVLAPHGFRFESLEVGRSGGGAYTIAHFARGPRSLELHVRQALTQVVYRVGATALPHDQYMQRVVPAGEQPQYRGRVDDPLLAFRELRADLLAHGSEFMTGEDAALRESMAQAPARAGSTA